LGYREVTLFSEKILKKTPGIRRLFAADLVRDEDIEKTAYFCIFLTPSHIYLPFLIFRKPEDKKPLAYSDSFFEIAIFSRTIR
jgi:hypothetical protein